VKPISLILVAGARPNFMKIAPLMAELKRSQAFRALLVHTGQHYDKKMSDLFFHQLGIPEPDLNLEVRSGSHAVQTAEIMRKFEPVLLEHQPDAVLVVGDVNSTIACGLVAAKLGIRLAHVEAGLRSFDRAMPEEINRVLTDAISDFLFCTEPSGVENLQREGVPADRIHLVGNVMIDSLLHNRERAESSTILEDLGLEDRRYGVVTLHRPSNVDRPECLAPLIDVLNETAMDLPLLFPIHPRTRARMEEAVSQGVCPRPVAGLRLVDPLGYLEFLKLMARSRVTVTDSGGIQEETTILGVPCLTIRQNTERPITIEAGTNRLVGTDPAAIRAALGDVLANPMPAGRSPPLWDGCAAERIIAILSRALGSARDVSA
jgi:UDP-N-acetylglucosamine 2-epimerase (non-hydrolysing)